MPCAEGDAAAAATATPDDEGDVADAEAKADVGVEAEAEAEADAEADAAPPDVEPSMGLGGAAPREADGLSMGLIGRGPAWLGLPSLAPVPAPGGVAVLAAVLAAVPCARASRVAAGECGGQWADDAGGSCGVVSSSSTKRVTCIVYGVRPAPWTSSPGGTAACSGAIRASLDHNDKTCARAAASAPRGVSW